MAAATNSAIPSPIPTSRMPIGFSMPPMIAAANALSPSRAPISACAKMIGATSIPAIPARIDEMMYATTTIWRTLIPIRPAAAGLNATAWSALPNVERLRKNSSAAIVKSEATMTNTSCGKMPVPPMKIGVSPKIEGTRLCSRPQ